METVWKKTLDSLRGKMNIQLYETWIQPIRIVGISGKTVELSVPNRFFRDWIEENYLPGIREALAGALGTEADIRLAVGRAQEAKAESSPARKASREERGPSSPPENKIFPRLNVNYSFDRFVVGSCNQFAHAASVAVAKQPARIYNPLFIYGGVGLGKTHLLNAVGLLTLNLYPEKTVLYLSAEEFMNELIYSIRYDRMTKFREKYRKIDSLLIDDIQFIAGKERTQEEFFHTFNSLHDSGKQIVVTSDRFPKDIQNLEERLRSRFEWGLIADIQPPEIETRIAIIEKKAQENNMNLPGNVSGYIATHAPDSNIRELEGFLTGLMAYSSLTGKEIDLDLAQSVLRKLIKQEERRPYDIEEIVKATADFFGIKIMDIKSQKKSKNLAVPRQIAMYLSRTLTSSSFPDIGNRIGGKDHSTVIYAFRKIQKLAEKDPKMEKTIADIMEILKGRP